MRTRLSVAVAAFILHAMQGPWPGAIGHTIKYLKAQGGMEIALQVLVLIPEEFTTITFTAQSKVGFCTIQKLSFKIERINGGQNPWGSRDFFHQVLEWLTNEKPDATKRF